MANLFKASNISISFVQYTEGLRQRTINVIEDLSIDVNEGEIVTILGASGSGKSLLADSILGILPNNSILEGEMEYKGKNLTEELKEELRGHEIALIPQSVKYLDPLMTVVNQVIGPYSTPEEKEEKIKKQQEIFKKYNLSEDVGNLYPFQLSGGMARRVLISTALMNNPKFIIADEPTPGLDEKSIEETLNYIRNMAKENAGILLITHDIEVALEISDRIAIFYGGQVIEIAPIDNFRPESRKLLHPYTRSLIKALPGEEFELDENINPLMEDKDSGCIYYSNCPEATDDCIDKRPNLKEIDDTMVRCHRAEEFNDNFVETELTKGDI